MKSEEEVSLFLKNLGETDFIGRLYDVLSHNCCHFCVAFADFLDVDPVPSWVMNLASAGLAARGRLMDCVSFCSSVATARAQKTPEGILPREKIDWSAEAVKAMNQLNPGDLSSRVLQLLTTEARHRGVGVAGLAVVASLALEPGKTELDLSGNVLSLEAVQALACALEANTTVKKLMLSNTGIEDAGATAIGCALERNTSLTKLLMSYNQITDVGALPIREALRINNAIVELQLDHNEIGETQEISIQAELTRRRREIVTRNL